MIKPDSTARVENKKKFGISFTEVSNDYTTGWILNHLGQPYRVETNATGGQWLWYTDGVRHGVGSANFWGVHIMSNKVVSKGSHMLSEWAPFADVQ